jgi:hypothetical protein
MVSRFHARNAVLIACASLMPLGAAQAQGLFDFLFSPRPAPSLYYLPSGPRGMPPLPRMFAPRQRHVRVTRKARPSVAANHAPRLDIMTDRTLRDGDAVMTTKGLRIFTGEPGSRHRPEDFAPPAEINGLTRTERAEFAELDKHMPLPLMADLATGRSVATPDIASRRLIEDPRHGVIRYVGP